jgi:hypothetical protein
MTLPSCLKIKMSCHQKTLNKVMSSVRRKHPSYGLERRKKIARGVIYGRK